jgi:uncharacterized protein DUF5675
MQLSLVRDYSKECTLGILTVADLTLQTLELPWIPEAGAPGGEPDKSCVPAGTYALETHDTADHPHTWALVNHALGVWHESPPASVGVVRTACLIHVANYVAQLLGCIGVGEERLKFSGSWSITKSALAFQDLKAVLPWVDGNVITITYASGVAP